MMNNTGKQQALMHVNAMSIAALDTALFLDTHPDNCEAMEAFNKYNSMLNQARKDFSKRYGPLTLSYAENNHNWEWVSTPWPWEGACK